MILRNSYEGPRALHELVQDLRVLLNASDGGIRHSENVGPVLRCRYLDGRALHVQTSLQVAPIHISATVTDRVTGQRKSNPAVDWVWGAGTVKVTGIDVTEPSHEHDVVLLLWVK